MDPVCLDSSGQTFRCDKIQEWRRELPVIEADLRIQKLQEFKNQNGCGSSRFERSGFSEPRLRILQLLNSCNSCNS